MMSQLSKKNILWLVGVVICLVTEAAFAVSGVGSIATNVVNNLGPVARVITAGSYVAGFGFTVTALVKFKAHKDNPTQIPISMPIALLFIGAALIFVPSVFKSSGVTLFGGVSGVGKISGISTFT